MLLEINFMPYVPTTLIGFLGLISGYIYFHLKNKNENEVKKIESINSKDRLAAMEISLNELGVRINTEDLSATQKMVLIKKLLNSKINKYLITSITLIILSGFVTLLIWNGNGADHQAEKNKLPLTDKKTDSNGVKTPDTIVISKKIDQVHFGTGDNVAGDKTVINQK